MPDRHDHDLGFAHDLPRMLGRRRVLLAFGGLGVVAAGAFAFRGKAAATGTAADGSVCVADPAETGGPFPADGTNAKSGQTVNALTQQGVIRTDLRNSFGDFTAIAQGIELALELRLIDVTNACRPLAGHALYLWHCDAAGKYSLYDTTDRNYLRGVGISDQNGVVRFTTILPGCYDGRWPHMHFEVFRSAAAAVSGRAALLTSQFAMPEADCAAVYAADSRYTNATRNLGRVTLAGDNVFGDNSEAEIATQTPTLAGSPGAGYTGRAVIGLAA